MLDKHHLDAVEVLLDGELNDDPMSRVIVYEHANGAIALHNLLLYLEQLIIEDFMCAPCGGTREVMHVVRRSEGRLSTTFLPDT